MNVHPIFSERAIIRSLPQFAETWFDQMSVCWRDTTRSSVRSILDAHLLPAFEGRGETDFQRSDTLALRAVLVRGRTPAGKPRSARRVNRILAVLGQLLAERERQLGIPSPCRDLPALPTRRTRVNPLSLPELLVVARAASEHLQDYVLIRGLTGLRSGEANGLCWDQVDFEDGTITIAAARVRGRQVLPKNEYSERVIGMVPAVAEALRRQWARTGAGNGFVFQTARGCPLDTGNFARRDWPRALAAAGLAHRTPEELRHTAASLMLAAGEAPQFVAATLGHADCRMLFETYTRWIPSALGRLDGQALEQATGLALVA